MEQIITVTHNSECNTILAISLKKQYDLQHLHRQQATLYSPSFLTGIIFNNSESQRRFMGCCQIVWHLWTANYPPISSNPPTRKPNFPHFVFLLCVIFITRTPPLCWDRFFFCHRSQITRGFVKEEEGWRNESHSTNLYNACLSIGGWYNYAMIRHFVWLNWFI